MWRNPFSSRIFSFITILYMKLLSLSIIPQQVCLHRATRPETLYKLRCTWNTLEESLVLISHLTRMLPIFQHPIIPNAFKFENVRIFLYMSFVFLYRQNYLCLFWSNIRFTILQNLIQYFQNVKRSATLNCLLSIFN